MYRIVRGTYMYIWLIRKWPGVNGINSIVIHVTLHVHAVLTYMYMYM